MDRDLGKGRIGRHGVGGTIQAAAGQISRNDRGNRIGAHATNTGGSGDEDNVVVSRVDQHAGDCASGEDVIRAAIFIKGAEQLRSKAVSVLDDIETYAKEAVSRKIAFTSTYQQGCRVKWIKSNRADGQR